MGAGVGLGVGVAVGVNVGAGDGVAVGGRVGVGDAVGVRVGVGDGVGVEVGVKDGAVPGVAVAVPETSAREGTTVAGRRPSPSPQPIVNAALMRSAIRIGDVLFVNSASLPGTSSLIQLSQ